MVGRGNGRTVAATASLGAVASALGTYVVVTRFLAADLGAQTVLIMALTGVMWMVFLVSVVIAMPRR
ncbi:MAG: hypothetical protein Kow00122_04400 [Thermoleophilia bacterium]